MNDLGEKPYYSLHAYLRRTFGEKIYKLSLNGGMTCPNRDGTVGTRGCIFCSEGGSGDFAASAALSVTEQLEYDIRRLPDRITARRYIAYFQAYTNTYAPTDRLRSLYTEAMAHPAVAVLSVATRPDCLPQETVELLAELNRIKPVWVELGLQTMHEETARYIRRGYPLSCFEDAVRRLRAAGITVITHVILGLPGENAQKVYETVQYLNGQDIQGIKLQLLHVLEHTDLAEDYRKGNFQVLTEPEYVDLVCGCIARLRPDIVIHRLTGDGPSDILIEPQWSKKKMQVLNEIHHRLKVCGIRQGSQYGADKNGGHHDIGSDNTL